ncbi:TonB family protein [Marivita sp. XM-24bin2]|jgi:protein TonB|uniref:TonB family protein n=1 Tax=unclassified Marivita TaxID=2632480 RepID=UPI000D78E8AE|nr:TonB family protein [Marivita sp. XM-24bin2]MCR9107262.1 TonB family protein [Paracoccaceae bacterium]PWL36611.1 MAG: hypothetical protein DCO97_03800 [Marivita sp. XM-24bin2]
MRIVEFSAFVALSGALHAATLVVAPLPGGTGGGGANGASEVTLQRATPTLAALVQEWDRPPEVSEAPALIEPDMATAPMLPAQETPVLQRKQTAPLATPSAAPDKPQAETRLPAPPVPLAQMDTPSLATPQTAETLTHQGGTARAVSRPTAPQLAPFDAPSTALPKLDTTPAARGLAPTASMRPELRPDRPKAARTASSSAARPAQKAKGSGGQSKASPKPSKAPVAASPSSAQLARLEQTWGAQISAALRRAHRPPRGAQGSVTLVLAITPAGRVTGASLAQSSGNARLDRAALAAVKRARFPRAPEGLSKSSYRFSQRLTVSR